MSKLKLIFTSVFLVTLVFIGNMSYSNVLPPKNMIEKEKLAENKSAKRLKKKSLAFVSVELTWFLDRGLRWYVKKQLLRQLKLYYKGVVFFHHSQRKKIKNFILNSPKVSTYDIFHFGHEAMVSYIQMVTLYYFSKDPRYRKIKKKKAVLTVPRIRMVLNTGCRDGASTVSYLFKGAYRSIIRSYRVLAKESDKTFFLSKNEINFSYEKDDLLLNKVAMIPSALQKPFILVDNRYYTVGYFSISKLIRKYIGGNKSLNDTLKEINKDAKRRSWINPLLRIVTFKWGEKYSSGDFRCSGLKCNKKFSDL